MLLRIHPETPSQRQIEKVVECLYDGGVIIYPTDTVYGLGCDIFKSKAIERVARIKEVKPDKANFSFICHDMSQITEFTKPIDNNLFKLIKRVLPGPYTFILNANNTVPRYIQSRKKTVGIRIPDHNIPLEIVRQLGHPIMTTSIHDEDDLIEYTTDPELIYEKYRDLVDIVIDGGYGGNTASTILDCTGNEIEIIRKGLGPVDIF
ncbi:MAG TPA: L-threonylcarbamoyladenylate synthase [Bacteroidales bacterium]|nr:L-threonylcarbamoyladenylate synthase [Bacteroidales bacterium]HPR57003.1 L-threonylcarbamoyladenylate synthase [Bacteroidales bacterium]HRW96679.1 L-threonylcarbamoyladenylate synthase [Bacteroidales bacterium]